MRTGVRSSCRSSRGREFAMPWQAPHFVDALLAGQRPDRRAGAHRHDDRRRPAAAGRAADPALPRRSTATSASATPRRCWSTRATCRSRRGSARPTTGTTAIDGQVNGVLAKRSPGSTLKPFVYALALDQGVLHPQTMLRDAPTSFGPFTPENFDGRFFGPISRRGGADSQPQHAGRLGGDAAEAAEPVSVPAERRRARPEARIVLRPRARARRRRSDDGGARRALRDARQPAASLRPLRVERVDAGATRACGCSVRRRASSRSTCCGTIRVPTTTALMPVRARWPVAWKTGHVVGIPRRLVGRRRRAVRARRLDRQFRRAGQSGVRRRRCRRAAVLPDRRRAESGAADEARAAAGAAARRQQGRRVRRQRRPAERATARTPWRRGTSRASRRFASASCIAPSRSIRGPGRPACPPYPAGTRFEVFEFWSSDMLKLFRQAGMPRRTPPPLPPCATEDGWRRRASRRRCAT